MFDAYCFLKHKYAKEYVYTQVLMSEYTSHSAGKGYIEFIHLTFSLRLSATHHSICG